MENSIQINQTILSNSPEFSLGSPRKGFKRSPTSKISFSFRYPDFLIDQTQTQIHTLLKNSLYHSKLQQKQNNRYLMNKKTIKTKPVRKKTNRHQYRSVEKEKKNLKRQEPASSCERDARYASTCFRVWSCARGCCEWQRP